MAPKLRCPECDHRHSLDEVAHKESFRCQECGRVLKVPERYRSAVELVTTGEVPIADGRARATPMAKTGPGSKLLPPLDRREVPEAGLAPLAWGWRLGIWIVAVPLGAVVGGLVANALGLLTLNQLEDAFLESGLRRFTPLARFVPVWAVVTALLVQGSIVALEAVRRRRADRRAQVGAADRPAAAAPPAVPSPADDATLVPQRSRASAPGTAEPRGSGAVASD